MLLLTTIILVAGSIKQTLAECNVCGSASKSACLSRNTFKLCSDDKIIDGLNVLTCPDGYICANDKLRCLPAESATASCGSKCQECDPNTKIACINSFTYALCLEKNCVPSTIFGFCENGKVCNSESSLICVDEKTQEATCPEFRPESTIVDEETTITTTESDLPSPTEICKEYGKQGKFPILGECNSYILCMMSGNNFIGRKIACWRGTVFDCKLGLCSDGYCDNSCSAKDNKY